jgi:putative transposase
LPCVTIRRWIREAHNQRNLKPAWVGRKPTAESIRKLIIKLARETGWGYTRILGELKKLGIQSVSRNTVKRILRANGLDPGPRRGIGTWDEFLKIHAAALWQCDFLAVKSLTPEGVRDLLLWRRAGTRPEKTARKFLAFAQLAATLVALGVNVNTT